MLICKSTRKLQFFKYFCWSFPWELYGIRRQYLER